MKNLFKLKITVTLESKSDESYSAWKDVFAKTSDEILVLNSETATVESLQKIVKANVSEVLAKTNQFIESSNVVFESKPDDPFTI